MPAKKPAARPAADEPHRHEFLSPSWIDAVRALRGEYHDRVQPPSIPVRANVVVTGAPFGEPEILGSIDTSSGQLALEAELQGEAGRSRDFREGVTAFLEKRPARYEGR